MIGSGKRDELVINETSNILQLMIEEEIMMKKETKDQSTVDMKRRDTLTT